MQQRRTAEEEEVVEEEEAQDEKDNQSSAAVDTLDVDLDDTKHFDLNDTEDGALDVDADDDNDNNTNGPEDELALQAVAAAFKPPPGVNAMHVRERIVTALHQSNRDRAYLTKLRTRQEK